MQAAQDPVYSQVGGLYTMGDESATLSITTQQGVQPLVRKVIPTVALTAARTLTLPTAAIAGYGTTIEVNDVFGAVNGANTISIARAGADTINGGTASLVLSVAGNRVTLTSDGVSKWSGQIAGGGSAGASTQAKYSTNAGAGATTAAAGDLTGANYVNLLISAVGAANLTTRTAAQMIADAGLQLNQTYMVNIANSNAGTTTLVGGVGVTVTGTATIAQNTTRQFLVKVTGAATITFQNVGTGTYS